MKNREKAMEWWNSLSLEDKFYQVIPYLKGLGMNVTDRHPNSFTGSEIEKLYNIYLDLN
jgi:hypothetical protein